MVNNGHNKNNRLILLYQYEYVCIIYLKEVVLLARAITKMPDG